MANDTKYISLKEAAQISGYAPDYIGQLIRLGKIPGQQVYSNVAWLTTEEAVREYLRKNQDKKEGRSLKAKAAAKIQQIKNGVLWEIKLFKTLLYLAIILSAIFLLLLFYIFSVSVEKKLQQKAIDQAQNLESKR